MLEEHSDNDDGSFEISMRFENPDSPQEGRRRSASHSERASSSEPAYSDGGVIFAEDSSEDARAPPRAKPAAERGRAASEPRAERSAKSPRPRHWGRPRLAGTVEEPPSG